MENEQKFETVNLKELGLAPENFDSYDERPKQRHFVVWIFLALVSVAIVFVIFLFFSHKPQTPANVPAVTTDTKNTATQPPAPVAQGDFCSSISNNNKQGDFFGQVTSSASGTQTLFWATNVPAGTQKFILYRAESTLGPWALVAMIPYKDPRQQSFYSSAPGPAIGGVVNHPGDNFYRLDAISSSSIIKKHYTPFCVSV